ncbi:MAG: DUF192 domain-containing protein [Chloroflexi bacterium]|nr:DUF192 domain-containing protein [Chloroflexota bacterium]
MSDIGARNITRSTVLAARLELGESLWARFMGLMGRASLPAGDGLWLSGTNGIHMFFMRFAIDAIFLAKPAPDGGRVVLAARRGVRPWVGIVPLVRGADGVIELPVGTIAASGTSPGDIVVFE